MSATKTFCVPVLAILSCEKSNRSPCEKWSLAEALPDLLGSKGTNSIEAETEYQPVFFSQSYVERVILGGNGAAIPTVAQCHC